MGVKKSAEVFMPVSKKTRIQIQNSGPKPCPFHDFKLFFKIRKVNNFKKIGATPFTVNKHFPLNLKVTVAYLQNI